MIKTVHRGLWLTTGLVFVVLGIIGILLPIMPGLIFFAMAVPAFMRCSRCFNTWIEKQPWFIHLQAWYQKRRL